MALAKLSLVLALFCGIASASWGPSDLAASVDNSKGDFADINVQWKAGLCPTAYFKLYTEAPEQEKTEETATTGADFTIVNKEFWTNYSIILETSDCVWDESPRTIQIDTGPGNPHKVTNVKTAPSAVDANVTISEAFMPRPVDQYNVTWCSILGCQTQIFARNNRGAAATFDFELKELHPDMTYNLTVAPEISFGGKPLRGSEYSTRFSTKKIQLPVPTDVKATFPWDEKMHQEVKLTWKLEDTRYELLRYEVNVTSESDASFLRTQTVKDPEVLFPDMPNSEKLTAQITPIFNISQYLMHNDGASVTFNTPHSAPEPANFTFVALSPTSIFALWNTTTESLDSNLTFNFTYTDQQNDTNSLIVNGTWTQVENLEANTTYQVVISLVSDVGNNKQLVDDFKTPVKDFAPPADVKVTPLGEMPHGVSYNLTWTSLNDPREASRFQIESCDGNTKKCTQSETKESQMVVSLDYFGSFSLTVTAIYDLALNQTQIRRSEALTVVTPGVAPLEVTNITLTNVTTTDAVVEWTAPANVPENVSRIYKVFDAENNLIDQTKTEQIKLSKLSPYSLYVVHIQATVLYNKTEFTGNQTFFQFYTDSAAPEAPETVEVQQIPKTNVFKVFWTAPKVMNGMLDYYEVVTKDESGGVVSNLTNLVGTKGTTVSLPSAHKDATYSVSVRAVNVNLNNEPLPGNATESVLSFKGIGSPTAEVVKRMSTSLIFKVIPSNETGDTTGLFFAIKNANNSFPSTSDHIEVNNLTAYTNTTVQVYACYLPTFCSEPFTITELTNVAGPSPVNDLRGDFTNRTVPIINWTAPSQSNGPLDGYLLNLMDASNSSVNVNEILPANQTSYVYETSMEFEKYTFTVSGFNYDLDEKDVRVVGTLSSTSVNTTGEHPPKPENVREVNKTSTSVSFQWEKPQYADFDVTYYFINVTNMNKTELTNETHFALSGLTPWTNITVETSGCTSDNITSCGLPGFYFMTTAVEKPSQPHGITFKDVAETEASVAWEAPLTPNGPISGYKIAVSLPDNQNLTWNEVEENATAHKFSNLTADTKYTVHILAYNIEKSTGEELPSPPSIADFTTAGSGGFAWWIIVVALIVIAAAAAIGTVVYRRRRAQLEDEQQLVQA